MLLNSELHVREAEHLVLAQHYADFLARGGRPERLPVGALAETTARQRINPTRIPEDERARQREAASRPLPRGVKAVREPKPPKLARPGSQKALLLVEMLAGPVSAKFLAGAIGTSQQATYEHLLALRKHDLVADDGQAYRIAWSLTEAGRRRARALQREVAP